MEEVFYGEQPEKILYMPLPNGAANVWLRRNICQVDTEELCGVIFNG